MKFPDLPEPLSVNDDAPISFHFEDVAFDLPAQASLLAWFQKTAQLEGKEIQTLSYIFCSDEYLLEVNREYLKHDYYTDVITFHYSEDAICGDIFISIDRVTENAQKAGVSFLHELNRVMIHGLLHLIGYNDKTAALKKKMTEKEDFYLKYIS